MAEVFTNENKEVSTENSFIPEFEVNDKSVVLTDSMKIYIKDIERWPLLTPEEERDLFIKLESGDQSVKEKLITSNLRLVVSIAHRYNGYQIPILDLVQEGNIGLIKAVERFDYTKGYRFSTYATWWIKQAITRYIGNCGTTIRLPIHMNEKQRKIQKAITLLTSELGYQPTYKEIAESLNISEEEVIETLSYSHNMISLDAPINEDGDSNIQECLADESQKPLEDIVSENMLRNEIAAEIDKLPEREADVIRLRFGLIDGNTYTLQEIGDMYHLSRERIRQIETTSLRKLKRQFIRKKIDLH